MGGLTLYYIFLLLFFLFSSVYNSFMQPVALNLVEQSGTGCGTSTERVCVFVCDILFFKHLHSYVILT